MMIVEPSGLHLSTSERNRGCQSMEPCYCPYAKIHVFSSHQTLPRKWNPTPHSTLYSLTLVVGFVSET